MSWETGASIAEIVSAVAVVISLLYLAVQIRAQNRESRMSAAHEIIAAFRSMQVPIQSAELSALWIKAVSSYESLSSPERMQLFAIVAPMLRVWEEAYMHHHTGHLDEETWDMMVAQFRDLMSMEAFQELWRLRKHVYIKRFAAFVDSVEPNAESYNRLYQTSDASSRPLG